MDGQILRLEAQLNDAMYFTKKRHDIKKEFVTLLQNIENMKEVNEKKYGFYRFHFHRLKSLYYRKRQTLGKAAKEDALRDKFKKYSNCFNLLTMNSNLKSYDDLTTETIDKSDIIMNKLGSSELTTFYQNMLFKPENMHDFLNHHKHYDLLIKIIGDQAVNSPSDGEIDELIKHMSVKSDAIRRRFMNVVVKIVASEREAFFFNNITAIDSIQRCLRQYAVVVKEGQKTSVSNHQLYCELFDIIVVAGTQLASRLMSATDSYTKHFHEAAKHFDAGVQHYKQHSGKVFETTNDFFLAAYENFKTACWIANAKKSGNPMLECRFCMTSCLLACGNFVESKLIALESLKIAEDKVFKFSEEQIQKARNILACVKRKDLNTLITYLETDQLPGNLNVLKPNSKLELYRNLANYGNMNVPGQTHNSTSFTGFLKKDPTEEFQTNSLTVLQRSVLKLQSVQSAVRGRLSRPKEDENSDEGAMSKAKHFAVSKKIGKILTKACKAHSERNYRYFLEILNEKYLDNLSLIQLKNQTSTNYEENYEWNIDAVEIKKTLLEYGFKPDSIAYFLLLVFEAITQADPLKLVGYPESRICSDAKLLLQAITSPRNDDFIDLNRIAIDLDEKLAEAKEKRTHEGGLKSKVRSQLKTFVNSKGVIDEEMMMCNSKSFQSRFDEVKRIAVINQFLFSVTMLGSIPELLVKQFINVLDVQHDYFDEIFLRIEIIKDFLWLFTNNEEMLAFLYVSVPRKSTLETRCTKRKDNSKSKDDVDVGENNNPRYVTNLNVIASVDSVKAVAMKQVPDVIEVLSSEEEVRKPKKRKQKGNELLKSKCSIS